MAYKVFTKETIFKKHPAKTFFRSLLPSSKQLAFAYATTEKYSIVIPKIKESVKDLFHKPMLNGGYPEMGESDRDRQFKNYSLPSYPSKEDLEREREKKKEQFKIELQEELSYMKSLLIKTSRFEKTKNLSSVVAKIGEVLDRVFGFYGEHAYIHLVDFIRTYSRLPDALQRDAHWKKIIDSLSDDLSRESDFSNSETTKKYLSLSATPKKHIEYAKQKLEDAFVQALKNQIHSNRYIPRKTSYFIDFFVQFPPQFLSQSTWHVMIDYFVKEMGKKIKAFDPFKYTRKVPIEHRNYLWKAFITQIIQKPFEHYSFDAIKDLNNIPKRYENYALSQLNIYWSGYRSSTIFERIITLNEPYKSHILKNSLKSPDCYLKTRIAAYEILEGREATFNEKFWLYHIHRLAKKGNIQKLERELKGSNLS